MLQEPHLPVGGIEGLGCQQVGVLWGVLLQVGDNLLDDTERGVYVDGRVGAAPGNGKEIDMGAVFVVKSGAELGELGVEGGGHGM